MSKKTEILYGIHSVNEALKAGKRKFITLNISGKKSDDRYKSILQYASEYRIPVADTKSSVLESIAESKHHQGVCAKVTPYPYVDFGNIFRKAAESGTSNFILILDNIVDPQNLGALARTALGVNIDGIIIPKDRAASPTPAVSRASAGAIEHVRIAKVSNIVNTIKEFKQNGIWIAGMDHNSDVSVYTSDFRGPIAIVVGSEGKGIRPLVKKNCDFLFSIPQYGPVESLNASVAGAVVMYEALRQKMAIKE